MGRPSLSTGLVPGAIARRFSLTACSISLAIGIASPLETPRSARNLTTAPATPFDPKAHTAVVLVGRGKASFAYLLRTVEGQRHDAAARAAVPPASPAGPTVPSADFERSQAWLAQQAEAKAAMAPPPAALLARRRLAQEQVA